MENSMEERKELALIIRQISNTHKERWLHLMSSLWKCYVSSSLFTYKTINHIPFPMLVAGLFSKKMETFFKVYCYLEDNTLMASLKYLHVYFRVNFKVEGAAEPFLSQIRPLIPIEPQSGQ